jgi:hypothetical protein
MVVWGTVELPCRPSAFQVYRAKRCPDLRFPSSAMSAIPISELPSTLTITRSSVPRQPHRSPPLEVRRIRLSERGRPNTTGRGQLFKAAACHMGPALIIVVVPSASMVTTARRDAAPGHGVGLLAGLHDAVV